MAVRKISLKQIADQTARRLRAQGKLVQVRKGADGKWRVYSYGKGK